NPTTTYLSILDATVANHARTAAIWVYRPHEELSLKRLILSLRETLKLYPHFSGELGFVEDVDSRDHARRFRRLQVKYGFPTDPGVEAIVAKSEQALSSILPAPGWQDVWDASQLPVEAFIPTVPLPPSVTGQPAMYVQLTTFPDALAVGVQLAHGIADAHTLGQFMHNWSRIHRRLPIAVSPLFNPALLDRAAAGDIDDERPDGTLLKASLELPMRRYDYWASADGCPAYMASATRVPEELDAQTIMPLGTPAPWREWDPTALVGQTILHFTADEVHRIWLEATSQSSSMRLSHLDTLIALLWVLINRARGLSSSEHPVYLINTLGMRGRLVPDNFVGSPLILGSATALGRDASSIENLSQVAESIRAVVNRFTPEAIGALLHDMAFDDMPQRIWHAFLGKQHLILTSWLRIGIYDVQFVEGENPKFATSVMPVVDGVIQILEAG
ncbi:hypothetical protein GLOTRDRAFT_5585, partial [Gloeophyllum trabeum ATCC 11539]